MNHLCTLAEQMMALAIVEPGEMVWRCFTDDCKLGVVLQEGQWYLGVWQRGREITEGELAAYRVAFRVPAEVRQDMRMRVQSWRGETYCWAA